MNAPGNRSRAVLDRVRYLASWLARERHVPVFDRLVRRGGGLLVLTALSVFAGWSITKIPGGDDPSSYPAEQCLRVTAVVRLATGRPETRGPFLLLQTARTQDASSPASRSSVDGCEASERILPLPPVHHRIFRRRGGVFELTPAPHLERVLDRLFEPPSELQDRPADPDSHPSTEAI